MRRATATAAATLAVCLLVAGPARAAELPGAGDLSPRLAKLARPQVRLAPEAVQARKLGLPAKGPGSLLRRGNRVLAYVRFDRGAIASLSGLRQAGAEVVDVSRRYQTVTVAAKPGGLRRLSATSRVASVREALAPVVAAECTTEPHRYGAILSEGVPQLNAGEETGEARNAFGVDGGSLTVGILSDSFDQATEAADGSGPVATKAAEDVASADLPGAGNPCGDTSPVEVLQEDEFGEEADEGRAMAQIVHDVAPGAKISFASAFNGEESFASNIETLAEEGANVIADDVFYLEEPFFQEGPVAVAVNEAVKAGATYFSAAGNDNLIDSEGHDIASWETPEFRDSGNCPQEVRELPEFNGTHCLDFDPGPGVDRTFGIKVSPGASLLVDLQWSEPWEGVETDLDAFLLNANGNLLFTESYEDNVNVTQRPLELLFWENESSSTRTVQLVINHYTESNSAPRVKFGLLENGSGVEATEYPQSSETDTVGPTVFGHSAGASAISVGAIRYNNLTEPERYSSRGPVRLDFEPVTGSEEPAEELGSPEILSKPDLIATDCGQTTFFASHVGSIWRFCGTSAAAPHAAGVAALMLDQEPGATPEEVRTAMQESAVPVGTFEPCAVGAGLVEAVGAIEKLLSPGSASPSECTLPSPEVSDEEARAGGEWGSETPPSPPTTPPTTTTPPPAQTAAAPVPPRTFIRSHPPHLIRTRHRRAKVVFLFGSDQAGVSFACKIDSGLFRPCGRRLVRRLRAGRHVLRVAAIDANGNADRTPAVFRFQIKRIR